MKTAIFGGTFDPIHSAHLTVAREAAQQFNLDRVLFIPAAHPPHKPESAMASYEHRYRMVELACQDEPRFVPSRLEEENGKSYSILTIEKLRASLAPADQLYFIIGADAFAEITSWHRWQDVVHSVEFIVVTRPGHQYQTPPGARVRRLDTVALPVSSSEIRQKLAAGQASSELPPQVLEYILEHGLYQLPETGA
ncbi:MAG TPA: nicotinate-nucleotide adenylyltransferase [Bryobacteraceae bacterium]|nr:nicotinate-nucleotide adenylyltransferase [Bryobacteraceae bacterium]